MGEATRRVKHTSVVCGGEWGPLRPPIKGNLFPEVLGDISETMGVKKMLQK